MRARRHGNGDGGARAGRTRTGAAKSAAARRRAPAPGHAPHATYARAAHAAHAIHAARRLEVAIARYATDFLSHTSDKPRGLIDKKNCRHGHPFKRN